MLLLLLSPVIIDCKVPIYLLNAMYEAPANHLDFFLQPIF